MRGALSRCMLWRKTAFVLLVVFPLIIPSDWTQDVPARYGKRHPGLQYSLLYPVIGGPGTETAEPRAISKPSVSHP